MLSVLYSNDRSQYILLQKLYNIYFVNFIILTHQFLHYIFNFFSFRGMLDCSFGFFRIFNNKSKGIHPQCKVPEVLYENFGIELFIYLISSSNLQTIYSVP